MTSECFLFCSSWHVELMLLVELMRRAPRTSSIPLSEMLKIARLVGTLMERTGLPTW
jgi:hypothetical protein